MFELTLFNGTLLYSYGNVDFSGGRKTVELVCMKEI